MAGVATFERTVATIDRAAEFSSEDELSKQIGHARPVWAVATLKDDIDNGLDAAERVKGITPVIAVTVEPDRLTVADNGPGIPADVVRGALDYSTRTTDKAHYVSPTRGRQGNALKCRFAAPLVIDGAVGETVVEAGGQRLTVSLSIDPLSGTPRIDPLSPEPSAVKTGTVISSPWPGVAGFLTQARGGSFYDENYDEDQELAGGMMSARGLLRAYALLNPHATFRLSMPGRDVPVTHTYPARRPGHRKWLTGDPSPPHWYTAEQLRHLIATLIRTDRAKGKVRSVRDFISEFKGLSATPLRKAVYEAAGLTATTLDGLFPGDKPDLDQIGRLHAAMCDTAPVVEPDKLWPLGKAAIIEGLRVLYGAKGMVRYEQRSGVVDGVPWALEVAFGVVGGQSPLAVVAGVNWSPALRLPFEGLAYALQKARADEDDAVVVAVHLVYPGASATDRAKSRYDLPAPIRRAMADAIEVVTERFTEMKDKAAAKQKRRRELDAKAYQKLQRGKQDDKEEAVKQVAFAIMPEAYRRAAGSTGMANLRQIMYTARKLITDRTGDPKPWADSDTFTQKWLPEYMRLHPEVTAGWDVLADDRGHFEEPHTGERIGIGTLSVRKHIGSWGKGRATDRLEPINLSHDYPTIGPANRYRAVLFTEKEGFDQLFKRAKLAERFDIAVMSTKGMPVTACRRLVDELSGLGLPTVTLHDFDRSGLNILNALRTSNDRYQFVNQPLVIDIGLRLADVRRLGLVGEKVAYPNLKEPKAKLRECGATDEECDFLVTRKQGDVWQGMRVELNEIPSDEIIRFVEGKLTECGFGKFIPLDDVLDNAFVLADRIARVNAAIAAEIKKANRSPVQSPADLRARVERLLAAEPAMPWDDAVYRIAEDMRL